MATEKATIDVGKLSALKCSVRSMTVPEKTRHVKYAPEALTAVIEYFNALQEKALDIAVCRASYIHGSVRAFILEVPEDRAGDIILAIQDDVTFETLDELGKYTLGQPVAYKEAEGKASRMSTIWKGRIKVPAGFSHDTASLTSQVTSYFNK